MASSERQQYQIGAKEINIFSIQDKFFERAKGTQAKLAEKCPECVVTVDDLDDKAKLEAAVKQLSEFLISVISSIQSAFLQSDSLRMATFLSVILVPIVSFMKPIMGVGSAITLLFQAYVCARIGMEYCKTSTDKSIAGVMAAVLAFKGSGWALVVGFAMNLMLSNMEFQKRKLGLVDTENVDQIETKDNEPS